MTDTLPGRSTPLRRVDRYALLTALAHKPRKARLQWLEKRQIGHIRAWPRAGGLSFRVEGGAAAGMGLPDEDSHAELHFAVRGLSFCCAGAVRKLQREQGRLMIQPETMEWRVKQMSIEGIGRLPARGRIRLKAPDGAVHQAALISVGPEALRFVFWPCPPRLGPSVQVRSKLFLPGAELGFDAMITQSLPVYPGSHGRILTAKPLDADEDIRALIDRSMSQKPATE
jgi:hypothetical protein